MLHARQDALRLADGTTIAYHTQGQGPLLVLYNGLTTTHTFWKHLIPRWAAQYTVLSWDLPGHGSSSPARSSATARIESQPQVVATLMDQLGAQQATHVGFSMGCQVMFETYKQFPGRCDALVALFGGAEHVLRTTALPVDGRLIHAWVKHVPDAVFWPGARAVALSSHSSVGRFVARKLGLFGREASSEDLREVTAHMCRVDPPTFKRMARSAEHHSALDALDTLDVPLLIVAGDRDPFAPPERVGLPLHQRARGSELVRLAQGTHTATLDFPEQIGSVVDDFMLRARTGASERSLRDAQ
jgi:pimeloyl-ACP methyl ester carboxylesterase